MVRNCYVEAEKLVWKNAVRLPKTGVIITGQPGIGMIISCISVCLHQGICTRKNFFSYGTYFSVS